MAPKCPLLSAAKSATTKVLFCLLHSLTCPLPRLPPTFAPTAPTKPRRRKHNFRGQVQNVKATRSHLGRPLHPGRDRMCNAMQSDLDPSKDLFSKPNQYPAVYPDS